MTTVAEGPFFDELAVGQVFRNAPGLTLTAGLASAHRAIVGGRLPLTLDQALAHEVAGRSIAPPALVWDVAIGQSTVATHHVKANLFYRGLVLRRQPELGDTLRTVTEVVGLKQNSARPGRRPTGLAALRITTSDQEGRPVLDFWRCAMLPLRHEDAVTGHADDLDRVGVVPGPGALAESVRGWQLDRIADRVDGPRFADLRPGQVWEAGGGDVVSSGPELARLTLNVAKVHHDSAAAGGERLVYGGHTIGLALAQVTRALPTIATVTGWRSCDHIGPVREGDTLRSTVEVEQVEPLPAGGGLAHLRSRVTADGEPARDVLDWRFAAVLP
jgi:acyl dehydratase